jgi:hypothetical protein
MKRHQMLSLLLFVACTSSSTLITDIYRDKDTKTMNFQRVAAIAIVADPAVRKIAEDEMVRSLGEKGVASYTLLTPEDEKAPHTVRQKLQSLGIDGAVTMRLLSKGDEPIDVRGDVPDPYKAFSGFYGAGFNGAHSWESVVRVETEIFSINDDKLLWSAATKTHDPSEAKFVVTGVAKAVADELRRTGMIQ